MDNGILGGVLGTPISPPAMRDKIVDQTFDSKSENAQSGKAVAEAISNAVLGEAEIVVDQEYSPESSNAQSGIAVAEGINSELEKVGFKDNSLNTENIYTNHINAPSDESGDNGVTISSNNHINLDADCIFVGSDRTTNGIIITANSIDCRSAEDYESPILIRNIATPDEQTDAANKKYVDDSVDDIAHDLDATIGDINAALDEIIALQEALIGGDIV